VDVLDHRVLLARVEVPRPGDNAQVFGGAVAALGNEHLRGLPAAGLQLGDVPLFGLADEFAVRAAARPRHRGESPPAVGADGVLLAGGERARGAAVAVGEGDESGAVEVHTVVVDQVRVLAGVPAAGPEPHLPLVLVDRVDSANDEVAAGDRVLLL